MTKTSQMNDVPKLIIIRGPSGAGKSSVARALRERTVRSTLLIEQDQFRRGFNDQGPKVNVPVWQMLEANLMIGLNHGFDVVLEGILNIQKPAQLEVFKRIFASNPEENYIFYMDVSFDETIRRHSTRPQKDEFGESEMREWRNLATTMGHEKEIIIPESSSFEETVKLIQETAGI